MDWVQGFQKSIDYIDEHITEPLEYERIAQEMNISGFYYQKIFSIICGISLGEYIRNRRLTLAGSELLATDEKVIDIALKYGYDTQEGFTRAFTRFHGVTPNTVRKNAVPLKSFSKLSLSISVFNWSRI
ncbi:MAG: helix-turn-helix domain-containing protein [Eubacterium sp.]